MELAGSLDRALQPGRVSVVGDGRTAEALVVDADRIGVVLGELRVERAGRGLPDALAALPSAVSEALRRPVRLVEADLALGGGVFRTPVEEGAFFELRTNGASATLDRWRTQDGRRAPVPWTLTREDLARLVGAMESVAASAD